MNKNIMHTYNSNKICIFFLLFQISDNFSYRKYLNSSSKHLSRNVKPKLSGPM